MQLYLWYYVQRATPKSGANDKGPSGEGIVVANAVDKGETCGVAGAKALAREEAGRLQYT